MWTSLIIFAGAFIVGGLTGFVTAAIMAATRHAELMDLWNKASRDAGRAERELIRLQARCQREFGARPPKQPTSARW